MPAANPESVSQALANGRQLIDQERWQEAEPLYEGLYEANPDNIAVRHDYATVKLAIGEAEEAFEIFDDLIGHGSDRPEVRFMRARALLELGSVREALTDLLDSFKRQPSDYCLRALAGAYWMLGDTAAFDDTLRAGLRYTVLLGTAADLMRMSGEPEKAAAILNEARQQQPLPYDAMSVLTQAYLDAGEAAKTEAACREALTVNPQDEAVNATLISALLMQGKAQEALENTMPMREAQPERQHWIAYQSTAYRMLGDARYDALVDLDRFVRPYRLPTPPGYGSIDEFNAAFLESLGRWQTFARHPLNQSLRHGSQTARDLTGIDDPVVRAYVTALDEPIRQYMADVGSGKDHPLTARNTGEYRITGCWSVKLGGGGWHVNHVHPEGWLSSAYYVYVPDDLEDDEKKAGWIKFGEPPFKCTPPLPPQKWIKPSAGTLLLFPSFLWHGTEPILDGSERVTAPFDAVPV